MIYTDRVVCILNALLNTPRNLKRSSSRRSSRDALVAFEKRLVFRKIDRQ